jgi:acetyl esterase/lipase
VQRDIEYARAGEHSLKLDLYLPSSDTKAFPLIVWVHGGAWRGGSKSEMPLLPLVEEGFAIASIDYRLSTVAPFPAQVQDIKAAIRFLRAKSSEYHCDPTRVAIAGASAGGHLAALVGVTNGNAELEGDAGDFTRQSSKVQAIVSFYGASNLQTILAQSTPFGLNMRVPALQLLFGGQPAEKPELARLASPVAHVDGNSPPLLLFHGDQDPQMPVNQSLELQGAYEKAHRPVELHVLHGAKHGGTEFYAPEQLRLVVDFLRRNLSEP